jgi:hypothetical protein
MTCFILHSFLQQSTSPLCEFTTFLILVVLRFELGALHSLGSFTTCAMAPTLFALVSLRV